MRVTILAAGLLLGVFLAFTARAQQSSWVEFPAGQSRIEFAVFGLQMKPSRGWELQGGSHRARNYQYLWGAPFQDKKPFARILVAQIKDASVYFTAPPPWQKPDMFGEFARQPATMGATLPGAVKTSGLGALPVQRFSAGGRECLAFGGLTNAGASSQMLYGEAMASGDTSVRGYFCSAEGSVIADADIPAILEALRFN